MRTAGGSFTSLVDSFGGAPVSVPIGDAYSGMQRGSLDCIVADPTNLISASLNEVVKDISDIPLGVVTGATWVYNKDSWARFSTEDRALLIDEMAKSLVRQQIGFANEADESLADAKGRGINLLEPADDLAKHIADFKASYISGLIGTAVSETKLDDAQALFDDYTRLQKEWTERLAGIDRNDEAAIVALVKANIYDKLDPATFGQ